ncbi:MAG: hypothetical protein LBH49_03200 [Puniceicoccales bacterium]|nr:hypothetical protein [Puniceicoccales bacterium]
MDVAENATRAFILFSDTFGTYRNYPRMENIIKKISNKVKDTNVIFNGNFLAWFNDDIEVSDKAKCNGIFIVSNQNHIEAKPEAFLKTFGKFCDNDYYRMIINFGTHELFSGRDSWLNFLDTFNNYVATQNEKKVFLLNSNLIHGFLNKDTSTKGVDPYVIIGNAGYVGWTTLDIFSDYVNEIENVYLNNHFHTTSYYKEEWFTEGLKQDGINLLNWICDYRNNEVKDNGAIFENNTIFKEFTENVKKCIDALATNNHEGQLYLNVVANARWREVGLILKMVLEKLAPEYGYDEIFRRLVINVSTSGGRNDVVDGEHDKRLHSWPTYNLFIGNSEGFMDYPVINLLRPGPLGEHSIVHFSKTESSTDGRRKYIDSFFVL